MSGPAAAVLPVPEDPCPRGLALALCLAAALPSCRPPSRSSGGSRGPGTSWRARSRVCPSTPRAAFGWPPPRASLHDPEAPNVWCAGRATPRARSTPGPGTTARSSRSRAARARSSSTRPSSRCTRSPWGPTGALYVATVARRQGLRGGRRRQGRAPSSTRRRSTSGPSPSTRRATCFVATGGGRQASTGWTRRARPRSSSPAPRPTSCPWPPTTQGNLYAGSAPGGIVYRIDPALKVFVLLDSPYREVKALDAGGGRQPLRRRGGRQAQGRAPPAAPRAAVHRARRHGWPR